MEQVQQKQNMETCTAVKGIAAVAIVATTALLSVVGGAVLYARGQASDKYSLTSAGGIAFSDFRDTRTGLWPLPPAPKMRFRRKSLR